MKIGRVSSLQYYCHGATRTRETQQGNGLQQSVDTCVRPDRNRLCGLRHLAAHSPRSHQNGDSGHDSKARLEQEFQSLYIADVVLRSHRQQDKKSCDGRTGDDLMLVKDSNYLVQYVCLTSQHTWESHVDLTTSGTMVDKRQTEIDQVPGTQKTTWSTGRTSSLVDKPLLPLAHPEGTSG